jgi:hypothetical protein
VLCEGSTKLRESMGVELYVVLPDAEWVKLQGRLVEALRKSIMKGPSNVWKALADVHIERAPPRVALCTHPTACSVHSSH